MSRIEFYMADEEPYGAFSNLSPHPVIVRGVNYQTAEHAYHAGRFTDARVAAWVVGCPTAGLLAHLVHEVFHPSKKHGRQYCRSDWDEVKLSRMRRVLYAKFTQHNDLRRLLLDTAQREIAEVGFIDDDAGRFWGEVNGRGENWLGRLLMELRDQLQRGVAAG